MKLLPVRAIAVLCFLGIPFELGAQSTGKIEGVVTTKETGAPLAGCQVSIEGTRMGNITNDKGYYFILNVPPGLKTLRFNFTGYTPSLVENVRIQAGNTSTVNAVLEMAVIELEMVVIVSETEPLIPRDNVQTKQRIPSDFSQSMPVDRIEDALALRAGVVKDEGGKFSIRGGRVGKEAVYIDGILVRAYSEQAYLSDRITADNTPLVVGKNAVEEVNVITGGFNAEYGQAQSGVINIISREGGAGLAGGAQWITDCLMPRTSDYGYNELSFELGGPTGFLDKASYFFSAELKGAADASPSVRGDQGGFRAVDQSFVDRVNSFLTTLGLYDPNSVASRMVGVLDADHLAEGVQMLDRYSFCNVSWVDTDGDDLPESRIITPGDDFSGPDKVPGTADDQRLVNPYGVFGPPNPARLTGNSGDLYTLSGKFTWYASDKVKMLASLQQSRNQRLYYQHENIFNAPVRRNPGDRVQTINAVFGLDWIMHQSAERSTNLIFRSSVYQNRQNSGALSASSVGRSTYGGFGFGDLSFISEGRTSYDDIFRAVEGLEPEGDAYPTYKSGYLNAFAATFTPLPGQRGLDNVYNPLSLFNQSGLPLRLTNDREKRITLKADFDAQVEQHNRAKMGVEFQLMGVDTRHFFYIGGPLQDAWSVKPKIFGGYAQNRLDLGDLVLDTGLRLDYFDPAADFPLVLGEALEGDSRYRAERRYRLSPRVEVGFPVTDKSQLRLSYGVFSQVPAFSDYYALINRDVQQDLASDNVNNYFGNGRLDIPSTSSFEAGLTMLVTEDLYLDFVGYNKDIRGNVAYRWLTPQQLLDMGGVSDRSSTRFGKNLFVATNQDHGNIKGFDITFNRRMSKYWSANAAYSLSFARSSASDPQEFARAYGKQIIRDPLTGRDKNPEPPSQQMPTDNDQTHTLNLQLSFRLPGDFGGNTLYGKLLRNTGGFFTWQFHSGRPYTVVNSQGYLATDENNTGRTRSLKLANLRLTRSFSLGRRGQVTVFGEVMNLFSAVNVNSLRVNPTTGQPGVDAYLLGELSKQLSSFARTPEARSVEQEATEQAAFSSDPAERLLLAQIRDLNGNGLVEYPETFALSLAALMAAMDNPLSYLRPREVRLGVRFSF